MLMPVKRGFVFKNPVNLKSLEAVDWPRDQVARFATVCRQDIFKGVDVALRVLAGERWRREREWVFDVYGDGPLRGYLEGLARYLGHDERRVRFRGATSDVRQVWAENHVLLLPSKLEGLPLTIVEAAICGRVIVATDVGGVKTWCDAGGAGFVAAAPTVAAVGEAMEEMWRTRERWEELGAQARRYALEWYGKGPELELLDRLAGVVQCPTGPAAEVAAGV
jgi:glycosyltransferase involved in cell wall biosynthesis